MESLSDTKWDVVISGTGLQQSLLALALSRSGKNILHVDPNEYYGGAEAALSLDEADEWAAAHQSANGPGPFVGAQVTRTGDGLSSRAYSLALAPHLIHARSQLVSQLVSSKAYRQIEFLAVGSFYIYQPAIESSPNPALSRIPSTREEVFSNAVIPAKAKRALMKFLRFVLEYDAEPQTEVWKPHASTPLVDFLAAEFKLDANLQSYVIALTLSLDGRIPVESGLFTIHRHLTSMGVFGASFAAVYPKWGGLAEVAQVGCRAGAVGGAVYMLGTGIREINTLPAEGDQPELEITLTNDTVVKTKRLVQETSDVVDETTRICRLTVVVKSKLSSLFQVSVEDAPKPAVAVVAFPPGTVQAKDGTASASPLYAMVHSSDTGECPTGQCTIYLSTASAPRSKELLEQALSGLLAAHGGEETPPTSEYQLYYQQRTSSASLHVDGSTVSFPSPMIDLTFNDSILGVVREAWNSVSGETTDATYMQFEDRENFEDDDAFDS